jgi:voltage-gated potassium channel
MTRYRINDWIGLSGVADSENVSARRWAKYLEWPMLLLALWILINWYWSSTQNLSPPQEQLMNWTVWLFFIFETALLTALVNDKSLYLRNNWMNLLIIAAGIPVLWGFEHYAASLRILRLLIFLSLLLQLSRTVRTILARNHLGLTLMISFFIILISGYLIAGLDPNIQTPIDGIWWAWVTVTTVGYGDLVPVSTEGRIFGALLILLGIGLFSMLTAAFSAFFISTQSDLSDSEREHYQAMRQDLKRLNERLECIEQHLKELKSKPGQEQE